MKKVLLLPLSLCALVSLIFVPELFQSSSIKSSISKIEFSLKENNEFKPEQGYNIHFQNGEWLIIDLHHGSAGYTIAYDSNHKVSIISDYSTIYPSYEVWGSICTKSYRSIENFFLVNDHLNWEQLK